MRQAAAVIAADARVVLHDSLRQLAANPAEWEIEPPQMPSLAGLGVAQRLAHEWLCTADIAMDPQAEEVAHTGREAVFFDLVDAFAEMVHGVPGLANKAFLERFLVEAACPYLEELYCEAMEIAHPLHRPPVAAKPVASH